MLAQILSRRYSNRALDTSARRKETPQARVVLSAKVASAEDECCQSPVSSEPELLPKKFV